MGGKKIHTLMLMYEFFFFCEYLAVVNFLYYRFYPLTLALSAASVVLIFLFQVPLVHEQIEEHVGTWLGLYHYNNFSKNTWPVLTGYAAIVLLFLLVLLHYLLLLYYFLFIVSFHN